MKFSIQLSIVITFIVVLVVIQETYAIKCWDCRSDVDPRCSDPFDNRTFSMTHCPDTHLDFLAGLEATMCRKIRQKVHGTWKYFRSCAFLGEPGIEGDERFCLMRTGTYNIFMEYCTCNSKDGCNTSSRLPTFSLLILTTIVFVPFVLRNLR